MARVCVPPGAWSPGWAVEITPPVGGPGDLGSAVVTEFTTIPTSATFPLDSLAKVSVSFSYSAGALIPTTASVVLAVPSAIPGRPDATFEAMTSAGSTAADMTVPGHAIGSPGTLTVTPLSGDDVALIPPRTFAMTVATGADIAVKPDLSIHGKLLDPFGDPLSDKFVARAFQQGQAVSNGPIVDTMDGSFLLFVPATVAVNPLVVDLVPQTSSGPNPWFASNPMQFTDNVTLPTVKLPPYLKTGNLFRVTVVGDDSSMPVVPGTLVRALTDIPQSDPTQASIGSTKFLRDLLTGDDGTADTTLIPGTRNANQIYEIAVIPPTGSPYATTCLPRQPVGPGSLSTMTPANLPTIVLPRRPVLYGNLRDATGTAVANAIVTATPTAAPIASCTMTMTRASPGSTLTDAGGRFALPLDPGTYQLDYDPPAGSAVSRFSERTPFSIAGDVSHVVSLPASRFVEGTVLDGNTPLAGATVRIFEPRCPSSVGCVTPPWLIAQTQSDAHGLFRAVVPGPN